MIFVFDKQTKQLKQTSFNVNVGPNNDTKLVLAKEYSDEIISDSSRRQVSGHKGIIDSSLFS